MVYFITGLPGTGKTTAAEKLCDIIKERTGIAPVHLDGDNMRKCWSRIGYEIEDRFENIFRIQMVAKLFHDYELDVVVSVVAPSKVSRNDFREAFKEGEYVELLLTKIHEMRPKHYYPNYEPSDTKPEYKGEEGFEKLCETVK
jgi:adenylylsulfate kinase-like enzyme